MAVLGRWKAANTANLIGVAVLMVFDDFFSRGESRKCGLGGQKSRFHRHRTRPPGVDDCGRGKEARLARGNPRGLRDAARSAAMRLGPGKSSKLAPMVTSLGPRLMTPPSA